MESSENQSDPQNDAQDTAQPPDEVENDAQAEHTPVESLSAPDEVPAPIESATDKAASDVEPAQPSAVEALDPWYPVVGVADPVLSAVELVPGAETPISTADSSEEMASSYEALAAASDGPVWPAGAAAPEAASVESADPSEPAVEETPAEQTWATDIPVAVAAGDAIDVPSEADATVADLAAEPSTDSTTVQAEETSAASDAEASAAIVESGPAAEVEAPAVAEVDAPVADAPADEAEVPETIEAGVAAAGVAGVVEAAAPNEVGDPAASSGAWPEPPTPWADTGAIAAVGEAIAAAKATQPPAPEPPSPEATAAPDVSEIPTVVNTPKVESPQVDATPPLPETPLAYAQPPAPVGYAAPPQPVASVAVAPQASAPNTTPVIVEAILAFFGIYGVGWLISGETTIGVALLIAGFVWDAIFVAAAFTVLGLCCVVPLQLIFVALSAFQLNNRLHMRG